MAKIITLPKQLLKKGELIILPRSDYEDFLNWQKSLKTYKPTAEEKKELKQARREFKQGKYITLQELKNDLGSSRSSKSR